MDKSQINQNYYQTHKEQIKIKRKQRYLLQKQHSHSVKKSNLGEYYHANNIRVLISLRDYLDSSSERMKLWYRFSAVLNQIKEGVSDIIEIMRLREVMHDLIKDYWQTAKKQIRITKKWNKLTPQQQETKRKQWQKELEAEERELFRQFEKQQENQMRKEKVKEFSYQSESKQGKSQCPECQRFFKELDEENGICAKCVKNYEE